MEQTDSQSGDSPPANLRENDFVILPHVPHLMKLEKLGEPAAELENFGKKLPIALTEDCMNVKSGFEEVNEEAKWVNVNPKKDFYTRKKIRKLLLCQEMPAGNLWRGTLVHGIPETWYNNVPK